jgi:L-seryl-tRNA(Ser) seleniumtransferase
MKTSLRRSIPAVESVLQAIGTSPLPRPLMVREVREELAAARRAGHGITLDDAVQNVRARLDRLSRTRLQPVINATGILLHTNLGRAPLSHAAIEALRTVGGGYSNLEFDLADGVRGPRASYLEGVLALLCEAEAATVVNNCAAALILVLRHLTSGPRKDVVISRGELIQIGGGFRIPEMLESAGARLREVGTTNRTSLEDYERALGPDTGLILKVHRSNFFMEGFVESVPVEALSSLARRKRVPLVEDLGSGAVFRTEHFSAGSHEPTPAESLRQGVDLVCFSGDKLFGGPQAGVVAGRKRLVSALKREPLFRALRCGKLVFAALQATVESHLGSGADACNVTPLHFLAGQTNTTLRARAEALVQSLDGLPLEVRISESKAQWGGGTLPATTLPSTTVDLKPMRITLADLAERLRRANPPVVACTAGQRLKLDLRTVFPDQDALLARVLRESL